MPIFFCIYFFSFFERRKNTNYKTFTKIIIRFCFTIYSVKHWRGNMNYDVIIVGAGPSGIFAAKTIKERQPDKRVLLIEKGKSIENRICPKRISGVCVNCNPCHITTGFSGAGAFSDGKLTAGIPLSVEDVIGGNLPSYIGLEEYERLFKQVEKTYIDFGADEKLHGLEQIDALEYVRKTAYQNNLKLIESPVRHLGTEKAYEIYKKIQHYLEEIDVEMMFSTLVTDVIIEEGKAVGVITNREKKFYAAHIILSVGREGSDWFKKICDRYSIYTEVGTVDVGVRMEVDSAVTEYIDENLYEAKLINYSKTFDDKVRTFCWNPRGEVTEERYDGHLAVANGHSYKEENLKTRNTNFALLVSLNFTEPFNTPIQYGKHIAKLGNMLSGGKVLVQRYGDLKRGRRTTMERLSRNNLQPTLKDAIPGDLGLVLPYRIMLDITETIEALDKIIPGFASDGTLMYGIEVKFYSNKVKVDESFETSIKNLIAIGDGAGITRGLIQSSMNGVFVGEKITESA